jgi:hypothetical protein
MQVYPDMHAGDMQRVMMTGRQTGKSQTTLKELARRFSAMHVLQRFCHICGGAVGRCPHTTVRSRGVTIADDLPAPPRTPTPIGSPIAALFKGKVRGHYMQLREVDLTSAIGDFLDQEPTIAFGNLEPIRVASFSPADLGFVTRPADRIAERMRSPIMQLFPKYWCPIEGVLGARKPGPIADMFGDKTDLGSLLPTAIAYPRSPINDIIEGVKPESPIDKLLPSRARSPIAALFGLAPWIVRTPRFTRDIDELRTYNVDIQHILSENAIKDQMAELDAEVARTIRHFADAHTKLVEGVMNIQGGPGVRVQQVHDELVIDTETQATATDKSPIADLFRGICLPGPATPVPPTRDMFLDGGRPIERLFSDATTVGVQAR